MNTETDTPRILPLPDDEVPQSARAVLQRIGEALGKVPNLHRTLAHAPAALRAYTEASRALAGGVLPPHTREQIAVATAGLNRCSYCASAHTALGKAAGLDADELEQNLAGQSAEPRTAALLAFVRALVEQRGIVDDDQMQAMRDAGYGDAELVEVVAHVGLNTFTNTFNVFARTEIDFPRVEAATPC